MEWLREFIKMVLSLFKAAEASTPEVPSKPIEGQPSGTVFNIKKGGHGIDISHHNSSVNLDKVKQDFIFMKATEGKSFVSPVYKKRMLEAMSKNIPCGAYHYYKPGVDPVAQAWHFINHIMGDLPPVLDIEELNGQSKTNVKRDIKIFLDEVEKAIGKTPIIYTGYSFIKDMALPVEFAKYPLWLAWYTTPDRVKAPAPWSNWTFWQYSETAQVAGVGKCDVNWFNG